MKDEPFDYTELEFVCILFSVWKLLKRPFFNSCSAHDKLESTEFRLLTDRRLVHSSEFYR